MTDILSGARVDETKPNRDRQGADVKGATR